MAAQCCVTRYIDDIDTVFALGAKESGAYLPAMLTNLNVDLLNHAPFADQQLSLLRELSQYGDEEGIGTYFKNSGGMFNIYSKTAYERMSHGQLKVLIGQVNVALAEISDRLRTVNSLLFGYIISAKGSELSQRIDKLQVDVTNAKKAIEAQNNKPGLMPLLQALEAYGEAVIKLGTAVSAGDLAAGAKAIPDIQAAFQRIQETQKTTPTPDLKALEKQLDDLQEEYFQLTLFVNDQKASYLSQEYADLTNVLRARYSIKTQLMAECFQFHDLLRTALVGYLVDPGKDTNHLRTNLRALRIYLDKYPNEEPFIVLRDIAFECSGATSCLTLEASTKQREVRTTKLAGRTRTFVLYVLAPADQQLRLPLHGAPQSAIKIVEK